MKWNKNYLFILSHYCRSSNSCCLNSIIQICERFSWWHGLNQVKITRKFCSSIRFHNCLFEVNKKWKMLNEKKKSNGKYTFTWAIVKLLLTLITNLDPSCNLTWIWAVGCEASRVGTATLDDELDDDAFFETERKKERKKNWNKKPIKIIIKGIKILMKKVLIH